MRVMYALLGASIIAGMLSPDSSTVSFAEWIVPFLRWYAGISMCIFAMAPKDNP